MALPKIQLPLITITSPISGKKIKIRPFTVKEEKLLLLVSESKETKDINDILRQIIYNCSDGKIDSYQLPMCEMEFIFTELRKISVGETIEYLYKCQSCGMKYQTELDLNNLSVEKGSTDTLIRLDENIALQMRYPSQTDENDTDGMNIEQRVMEYCTRCIETIYIGEETHETKELSKQEVEEFIDSLPGKAMKKLIEFFTGLPFCYIEQDIQCPKCSEKSKIRLEGMANFFGT